MNKVLLTGGEGFIGKHIQKMIPNCYSYDLVNGDDIRDMYKLDVLCSNERFDTCINLSDRAGVKWGEEYPEEFYSTNVLGLTNVVKVCRKYDIRLIHFSSSSVFKKQDRPLKEDDIKEPVSIYGMTKLMGELIIRQWSLNWTIIRPFTVLGGRGRKGGGNIPCAMAQRQS
jgi:nucleoside-diphosphate-sugar epimerase